jgi:tripartite-type tricarboxylate transporter receptor subunit TctC
VFTHFGKTAKKGLIIALGAMLSSAMYDALAQTYPAKPVRMIVASPAGSVPDTLARSLGIPIGEAFGHPVIVENRPGANGNIGMEACARATPDGYTICLASGAIITLNPFAYARMPFEAEDLVPVVHIANFDQAIGVTTSLPVNNIRELVEYAKAKPGALSWASLGNGSTAHLYMEWLQAKTGARFVHVPYKGSPQALQSVAVAETHITTLTPTLFAPFVASGKIKVLAVVSGAARTPSMPNVLTFAEQGYDLDFRNWVAFYYQKGTPIEPVRRWNAEVNRLIADPAFVQRFLTTLGISPAGGSSEALAAFVRKARVTGAELAKIANLKFD